MSYSDGKFQASVPGILSPVNTWGTATASGAVGHDTTAVIGLPKYFKATKITDIKMRCTVIPNAASTTVKANFLNGTNTFATVTLTTATAGQVLDATMTASNGSFAADAGPTVNLVGTSTASAAASGSWEVFAETQELFS